MIFPSFLAYSNQAAQKDLPTPGKISSRSIDELTDEQLSLNKNIGIYPPRYASKNEEKIVYEKWSQLFKDVAARVQKQPKTEKLLNLYADLLRQGHNMDVKSSGKMALDTIEECLKKFPKSKLCHETSSYFYLQVAPKWIDRAKRSLDFLKKYYAPKLNETVERGYVFYYIQTKQQKLAQAAVSGFMKNFPNSSYNEEMKFFNKSLQNPIRSEKKQ